MKKKEEEEGQEKGEKEEKKNGGREGREKGRKAEKRERFLKLQSRKQTKSIRNKNVDTITEIKIIKKEYYTNCQ